MALFSDDGEFRDPLMWIIASIVGLLFGLLIGHSWLRSDTPAPRASRGTNS